MQDRRTRAEENALLISLAGAAVLIIGVVAYMATRVGGPGNNDLIWVAVMVLGAAILIFGYTRYARYARMRKRTDAR